MASASPANSVILVVDDEALLRLNAVDLLEEAGFLTFEAGDAVAALAQIEAHPEIAVLFTDINMPGPFDGLELARLVHARRPAIKLIITSGRAAPLAGEMPADGVFVPKPYDTRAVAAMAREVRA